MRCSNPTPHFQASVLSGKKANRTPQAKPLLLRYKDLSVLARAHSCQFQYDRGKKGAEKGQLCCNVIIDTDGNAVIGADTACSLAPQYISKERGQSVTDASPTLTLAFS